jgi:hypothetical protein
MACAACAGPAAHADSTLKRLKSLKIVTVAPPGGHQVAHGEDRGSHGVGLDVGRPAQVVSVFASTRPSGVIVAYYYRQYHLTGAGLALADLHLSGGSRQLQLDVFIDRGYPHLPAYSNVHLAAVRNDLTYVVVEAAGVMY